MKCAVAAVSLMWVSLRWAAAQGPQTPPASATITANSTLVVLPTLVRKTTGELVYGLTARDFTVTDDGVAQPLQLEEDTGGEPLALVVVIEAEAATRMAGWHPYRAEAPKDRFRGVPALVEAMVGAVPHQVAVVGFDSRPELELDFTPDFTRVDETIVQLDQGNAGDHGAGILDSLIFAVNVLHHAPAGYRRAILLLSETNDRGSAHTLDEAVQAVTESNVAVYTVAFSTPFHEASEYGNHELPTKALAPADAQMHSKARRTGALPPQTPEQMVAERVLQAALFGVTLENPYPQEPGGCFTGDPRRNRTTPMKPGDHLNQAFDCLGQLVPPLGVAKLALIAASEGLRRNIPESVARLTGGEYFTFNGAKSLEQDLARLANHVPNRYVLSFQPQSPHPGMHVVLVRLKDYPELNVTARTAYWVAAGSPAVPMATCSAEPRP